MKSIVIGSLIAVAASGCVIENNNGGDAAHVRATWQIKSLASNSNATCPPGFDTAALYNQEVDNAGNPIGQPIIDLFNCDAGSGVSAPLPASVYQTWIEIANHDNTQQYAKSLSATVDVTTVDQTFSAEILTDGGYFQMAWNLVGAQSNAPLTCAEAGATGGVEAISTDVANPNNAASDIFHCTDHYGVTSGLLSATYTVQVDALNSAMQAVSTGTTLTNKRIESPNKVTDLGTVTLPITGM